MEWLDTAITSSLSILTTVMEFITSNGVFAMLFVAGTCIPAGMRLFKGIKKAAIR